MAPMALSRRARVVHHLPGSDRDRQGLGVYDEDRIAELRRREIAPVEKGFGGPAHRAPVTAEWLAAERPGMRSGLLGSPRVLLRGDALDDNLDAMAAYCAALGVALFPHGKTTM